MKRLSTLLVCLLAGALSLPAQAHGGWGHGGGGYGGGGWHRDHYEHGWVGPLVGAAVVGSMLYAVSRPPVYVAPVVAMPVQPVVAAPVRVAYYCSAYSAYYPSVSSCPVPWQQVPY